MLDLFQLRCFTAVAEELHFGRAALRLHMTQPPLSRQIQLLEHAIGTSLFARTSRTVRLTEAGRHLLPQARHLLQFAEAAAADVRRVASGEAGTLRIGFTGGSTYELLPRLVTAMQAHMPDVELILRELRTAEQMEALAAGRLDAALVRLPVDPAGVDLQPIARDALILAAPANHPAATRKRLPSLRDLEGQSLVMFAPEENRFLHDLVGALLRTASVTPRIVQQVNQVHAALALVSAGLGLAIVTEAANHLGMRGVSLRPFSPAPVLCAELYLAWRSNNENPALARFRARVVPHLNR